MRTTFLFLALMIVGCSDGNRTDTVRLDSDDTNVSNIAMSLDALETMSLPPDSAVLVPLDRSVLALDADSLAAFAADGSLADLLEEFVLSEPATEGDLIDGATLRTVSGLDFDVRTDGAVTLIGAGTLIEVQVLDGLTIIVLDDLFEP